MSLLKSFTEVVDHLQNRGELMKAYLMLRNAPSYIEEQEEVITRLSSIKERLTHLSMLQNTGTARGRFNGSFVDPEEPEKIKAYQMLIKFLERHPKKKIVDVGCYTGWLGRLLSRQGIAVHGIDIHPIIIQIAAFAATGTKATFEYLPVQQLGNCHPRTFDAVVLFDVLEHCFDTREAILSCEKALIKGGHMIINLPHIDGEQVAPLHNLDLHEHMYSFSPTKVDELFKHKKNSSITAIPNEKGVINWFITYEI